MKARRLSRSHTLALLAALLTACAFVLAPTRASATAPCHADAPLFRLEAAITAAMPAALFRETVIAASDHAQHDGGGAPDRPACRHPSSASCCPGVSALEAPAGLSPLSGVTRGTKIAFREAHPDGMSTPPPKPPPEQI